LKKNLIQYRKILIDSKKKKILILIHFISKIFKISITNLKILAKKTIFRRRYQSSNRKSIVNKKKLRTLKSLTLS
jgi:hypothetical protein